jgi:quercetin dioxygenase-like cupin family protein
VGWIGLIASCAQNTHDASHAGSPANDPLASRLARTEVQRASSSIPGRDIVQVRTEISPGVASGWHSHPGEEIGYIITGNVDMEIAERATMHLRAGDGFLIPPRVPHNAHDLGPETGIMLSTYLVEHDQPLTTLVTRD